MGVNTRGLSRRQRVTLKRERAKLERRRTSADDRSFARAPKLEAREGKQAEKRRRADQEQARADERTRSEKKRNERVGKIAVKSASFLPGLGPLAKALLDLDDTEVGGNAVREAGAIVRGTPKAGYVAGRAVAADLRDLPPFAGEDDEAPFAHTFRDVVKPIAKSYAEKYGPLLPGGRPASETWEQIKKEPIATTLDLTGFGNVAAVVPSKLAKALMTEGGPVTRYRATKALPPPRYLRDPKSGAEAQFPASRAPLTRALQRGRDRLSEKIGTAPARIAKQKAKGVRVDVQRRQAAFADDIKAVEDVPRKARAGAFYERQLPASARGGEGLQRVEADLRARAAKLTEKGRGRAQKRIEKRLDELDAQYEQLVERIGQRLDPYAGPGVVQAVTRERNARRNRLKGGVRHGNLPTVKQEVRQLAEDEIAKQLARNPGHPAFKVLHEREDLRKALNELGEASIEGQRSPMGHPRKAKRLLIQAERVKRAREADFDPSDAIQGMGRLYDERARIFDDAGKLNPETAARMDEDFARRLGYEDVEGAGFAGHRTKEPPRSIQRLGQTRVTQRIIGPAKTPPGIGKQRTGAAYESGRLRADPRVAIEDWQYAQRYEFHNLTRRSLSDLGQPIEGRPNHGWYVLNPEGQRIPRTWRDEDPRRVAEQEGIDVDAVVGRDLEEYVRNTIAKAGTKEASELISKSGGKVVQVPPEIVHKFFNQLEGRAGVAFGGSNKFVRGTDVVNDIMRLSTIWANPGYVPAQWVGNAGFALADQGPFYLPGNLARATKTLAGKNGAELRSRILVEAGTPPTSAIASQATPAISRGIHKFTRGESRIADDPWRVAAWYHHARRAGFRSNEAQLRLLRAAERGNKRAKEIATELRQKVNDAMVDFERLGPMEKAVAARFLFVYPWMRGASRYPFRYALDHPARSALIADAATRADEDPSLRLRNVPDWLAQGFPDGEAKGPLQRIINPRSVSTVSTPLEAVTTIAGALSGEGRHALSDFIGPQFRALIHGLEGRNRFGKRVGAAEAVKQDLQDAFPLGKTAHELIDPSASPKIYGPQDRAEVLRRRIGRGIVPIQIDTKVAYEQADVPPIERLQHSHSEWKKNLLAQARRTGLLSKDDQLPAFVTDAVETRASRYSFRQRAQDEAGRKLEPHERFQADVRWLVSRGEMDEAEGRDAITWAGSVKEDALALEKGSYELERDFLAPLYMDDIAWARQQLRDRGVKLPALR